MNRKIKLIWDFRGPDGLETAKHHTIHLNEFVAIDNLNYHEINHHEVNSMHTIAYIIVEEIDMVVFRDALKPHRGLVVS